MYLQHDTDPPAALVVAPRARDVRPFAARLELAGSHPRRWRVVVFGRPRAWLRTDDAQYDVLSLSAALPERLEGLEPLPARARAAREHDAPGGAAWWGGWARYFVDAFARAPRGALPRGSYSFTPRAVCTTRWPDGPHFRSVEARTNATAIWLGEDIFGPHPVVGANGLEEVVLARVPSPPDASRVKMYRRLARAGTLPPAVLLRVGMYSAFNVVLDGHDRLLAALLEGVRPRAFVLEALSGSGWPVAGATALARAGRPRVCVWSAPGGVAQWEREVAARLDALGPAAPRWARAKLLVNARN